MKEKLLEFKNLTENEIKDFSIKKLLKPNEQSDKIILLLKELNELILIPLKNNGIMNYEENWNLIKIFFQINLKNILLNFKEENDDYVNKDNYNSTEYIIDLIELIELFDKPFFTIQRFSELLINPNEHYNSFNKILFAFEKILNI